MKKHKGLKITALVAVILLILLSVWKLQSAPDVHARVPEDNTFTNAAQLANYLELGYFENSYGPISLTKAVLDDGEERDVWLVCLRGWEPNKFFNNNGWTSCMQSGNNYKSSYYRRIKEVLMEHVPEGEALVFAGHSLGGMVAEQLIGDLELKSRYDILYTVTFGSPLVEYETEKEGVLNLLGDRNDPVISLSSDTHYTYYFPIHEESSHIEDGTECHMDSYLSEEVWGAYDVVGQEDGTVRLTVDPETRVFYQAWMWS